jgi:hypothetical protein
LDILILEKFCPFIFIFEILNFPNRRARGKATKPENFGASKAAKIEIETAARLGFLWGKEDNFV